MSPVIVVGIVVAIAVASMFKPFWGLMLLLFKCSISVLKWGMIVGLIMGFMCSKQFYNFAGWTPITVLAGKNFYNKIHTEEETKNEQNQVGTADAQQVSISHRRSQRATSRPPIAGR